MFMTVITMISLTISVIRVICPASFRGKQFLNSAQFAQPFLLQAFKDGQVEHIRSPRHYTIS